MTLSTLPTTQAEPLIGTAVSAQLFILLETPQPWIKPALLSDGVPESLRQTVKTVLGPESGVRVHLICNEQTSTQAQRRILIFRRASSASTRSAYPGFAEGWVKGYEAWELRVETPEIMAPALAAFLGGNPQANGVSCQRIPADQRHWLICTHATHNECCGIYGIPFYQATIAKIQQLGLTHQVQPWEVTHIGGHRFAPTLIDFPQGRYYGNLEEESLICLLKQSGAIAPLISRYRGWCLMPKPLQVLEGELLKHHGWNWMQGQMAGRILDQDTENGRVWVELWFKSPDQSRWRYTAELHHGKLYEYQMSPKSELRWSPLVTRKIG